MRIRGWVLAFVTAATAAGVAPSLLAQSRVEPTTLRVRGSAEVRVAPDRATVQLGVVEERRTAQDAQAAVNRAARDVLEALRAIEIDERHVQTARIDLYPVYAPRPRGDTDESTVVGYRASNTLSVRVDRIGQVGRVVDVALDAGANRLERVSFEVFDSQASRQQALREAITQARGKAEAMAEALGLRLVGVVSVAEDAVVVREPVMMESRMMALQADTSTPVSAGEVSVSGSVVVEYRLE